MVLQPEVYQSHFALKIYGKETSVVQNSKYFSMAVVSLILLCSLISTTWCYRLDHSCEPDRELLATVIGNAKALAIGARNALGNAPWEEKSPYRELAEHTLKDYSSVGESGPTKLAQSTFDNIIADIDDRDKFIHTVTLSVLEATAMITTNKSKKIYCNISRLEEIPPKRPGDPYKIYDNQNEIYLYDGKERNKNLICQKEDSKLYIVK
jgi:hypothetical protein